MRSLAMTAMLVLAVSGLSACNRNKAVNNSAAATRNTATTPVAPITPAPPVAPAAGAGMDPAAFRAAVAEQCVEAVRAQPGVPAGLDLTAICGCATEATLAGRADPFAFTQSPEGQQVFNQALNQCIMQAGGAAADSPDSAEGGDEPTE